MKGTRYYFDNIVAGGSSLVDGYLSSTEILEPGSEVWIYLALKIQHTLKF
jgi:hypothetical protein